MDSIHTLLARDVSGDQLRRWATALAGLSIQPDAIFQKRKHSALVGSGLDVWLVEHGIHRVIVSGIRTEQCCETTTRHASDSGYEVDYVSEATLTFAMNDRNGRAWAPQEIKARTELVLDERFARIATVEEALVGRVAEVAA
jgi:nicotinamidase-related amidase